MKILIEKSRVMIGQNVDHLKNVSYAYTPTKESVTFFINDNYKTLQVEDITVNGVQMTTENIDQLLADLFKDPCCSGNLLQEQSDWLEENASEVSYIRNRPYSKQVYAEPMVFPEAVCAGHTLEVYKDDQLYRTYEWNGWRWVLIGADSNLIFMQDPKKKSTFEEDQLILVQKEGYKRFVTLESGGDYSDSMSLCVTGIEKASKDYKLGNIDCTFGSSTPDIQIPPIDAESLSVSVSEKINALKINDSNLSALTVSGLIKECILKDIFFYNDMYAYALGINGQKLTIDNVPFVFLTLMFEVFEATQDKKLSVSITNSSQNQIPSSIDIIGDPNGLKKKVDADVVIKNNSNLGSISMNDLKINQIELGFDNTLSALSFSNVTMTEEQLELVVASLVAVPQNDNGRSFNYSSDCIPALTSEQKDRLVAASWTVNL